MSYDQGEPLNPYAATSTIEASNIVAATRSYGGIGRLAYCGYSFLAAFVYNLVGLGIKTTAQGEQAGFIMIPVLLIYFAVLMWIVALRIINIGYSPWWCVGMIVPIFNILVAVRCIAFPKGYSDHRTLDTAGKIIVGIVLALFALMVVSIFFLAPG